MVHPRLDLPRKNVAAEQVAELQLELMGLFSEFTTPANKMPSFEADAYNTHTC